MSHDPQQRQGTGSCLRGSWSLDFDIRFTHHIFLVEVTPPHLFLINHPVQLGVDCYPRSAVLLSGGTSQLLFLTRDAKSPNFSTQNVLFRYRFWAAEELAVCALPALFRPGL